MAKKKTFRGKTTASTTTSNAKVSKTFTAPRANKSTASKVVKPVEEKPKGPQVQMIMPDSVYDQIRLLCKEIAEVEWSGILFYRTVGTFQKPEEFEIHLVDILLMDKGNKTYTEYELGPEVVDHMMDNPELLECKMGHIHSHNTMSVFFSGTDMSELHDNAPKHNIYVSLIVNNYMDFCAKVAFEVQEVSLGSKYISKDENGEFYTILEKEEDVIKSVVMDYDCVITSPKEELKVTSNFRKRMDFIIEKAEKAAQAAKNRFVSPAWGGTKAGETVKTTKTPTFQTPVNKEPIVWSAYGGQKVMDFHEPIVDTKPSFSSSKSIELSGKDLLVRDMSKSDKDWEIAIEAFGIYLSSYIRDYQEVDYIEDLILNHIQEGIQPKSLVELFMNSYQADMEDFFSYKKATLNSRKEQLKFYINVTDSLKDALDYYTYNNGAGKESEFYEDVIVLLEHELLDLEHQQQTCWS